MFREPDLYGGIVQQLFMYQHELLWYSEVAGRDAFPNKKAV
jgi:hypothetical protein